MRTIILTFIWIASLATAQVTMDVYESDGTTLFDNRNIAVGTQLKLIVSSDSSEFWGGGLFITDSNRDLALLSGSGRDPNSRDYQDCHLAAAGSEAIVSHWEDSLIEGFDLFSSFVDDPISGDWFVIDYTALTPGDPNVGFYEYDISWDQPNSFVTFHQFLAGDFSTDGIVNFVDFSMLASHWKELNCNNSSECQRVDLDSDGVVDANDLILFADDWLWGVSSPDPMGTDPTLIYSIVDPNGLDEVILDVNESVTFYVDLTTTTQQTLWAFDIEVNISDPNLGSIDNTAYDPNNPPGLGTARILASPDRRAGFDQWGPGSQQTEGISLSGVNSLADGYFDDGHLASFVYTCTASGDVTLNLINWNSSSNSGEDLYPTVESILIHQNDPYAAQQSMSMPISSTTESQPDPLTSEETLNLLNDIWETDDTIQDIIKKKDWNDFIKSVERSY